MDTNVSISRPCDASVDNINSKAFTRERVFEAASQGDTTQLNGLLDYLRVNNKRLTSPEFTDETNGKTALMKALLNLKDGKNDTVEVLLHIAEKTGDLEKFINASYEDPCYKGQTALHIAIERRSFDHVKLLVQKGADVQAKANGKFFQRNAGLGFYFGELPLSLAACTNQPNIVSFLMENPYRRADLTDKDSQGNTVLHSLVVLADNETENTDMIARMYDDILIQDNKLETKRKVQLEEIENNQGLTPLKLAAKLGKIGNRPEMLQIEPLRSLLKDKWNRFASKLFLMNFLAYLIYLITFTMVASYRKEGQPPFPIDVPLDYLRCFGEVLSVLGAVWFLYKAIIIFKRNPPNFKALYTEGFSEILFFLQATLLLICTVLYGCGRQEYVGLLVLSLALAWINVLHYSRGSKQMGMYSVMMQRMILGDLLHFLCVYGVLLFGFSAAIVALIDDLPPAHKKLANGTQARGRSVGLEPFKCEKPSYNDIRFTTLELFKFTIGMGNLEFTDHVQYKEVFYILLILYIVLTYILLLNMLIAIMGNTVERISKESENIWNLQVRIFFNFRVEEMNWNKWRSGLCGIHEEDPGHRIMEPQFNDRTPGIRASEHIHTTCSSVSCC
uniref:Ion transport domain-containing protein n=1 Tax=Dicentrarchus labrax TaxID=13489 RepID=A0A8C4DVI9_DICLA